MELRPLRALVEVVRQGGFSQAAKAVFATQPTVSKAVRQLEDELGMPLLDRHAQPLRLTAAGEIVYRRALALRAPRDHLYAEQVEMKGGKRGGQRRGGPPRGSSTLFAPMFARFRSRYPQVEISLVEHGSRRLEEMVMAGEIELAASLRPVPDHFEWQPVAREPLVALMPADHPKARAESVSLRELRESPFILFETGFALNRILHDACQRAGFAPAIAARSGQIDFIVA
ncbi:MAG: LysR substrate-binding domain-containing protein, partial [Achromobacter sp.]|uniref:LysR family transcriptional regulator n=1 Tax=Achromobacter sp. TaxID=134375 RepID=UPI0025846981